MCLPLIPGQIVHSFFFFYLGLLSRRSERGLFVLWPGWKCMRPHLRNTHPALCYCNASAGAGGRPLFTGNYTWRTELTTSQLGHCSCNPVPSIYKKRPSQSNVVKAAEKSGWRVGAVGWVGLWGEVMWDEMGWMKVGASHASAAFLQV